MVFKNTIPLQSLIVKEIYFITVNETLPVKNKIEHNRSIPAKKALKDETID